MLTNRQTTQTDRQTHRTTTVTLAAHARRGLIIQRHVLFILLLTCLSILCRHMYTCVYQVLHDPALQESIPEFLWTPCYSASWWGETTRPPSLSLYSQPPSLSNYLCTHNHHLSLYSQPPYLSLCTHNHHLSLSVLTTTISLSLYSQPPSLSLSTHNHHLSLSVLTTTISLSLYSQPPSLSLSTHNHHLSLSVLTTTISLSLYSQPPSLSQYSQPPSLSLCSQPPSFSLSHDQYLQPPSLSLYSRPPSHNLSLYTQNLSLYTQNLSLSLYLSTTVGWQSSLTLALLTTSVTYHHHKSEHKSHYLLFQTEVFHYLF